MVYSSHSLIPNLSQGASWTLGEGRVSWCKGRKGRERTVPDAAGLVQVSPHGLLRDENSALGEQAVDISKAEREAMIEPE